MGERVERRRRVANGIDQTEKTPQGRVRVKVKATRHVPQSIQPHGHSRTNHI